MSAAARREESQHRISDRIAALEASKARTVQKFDELLELEHQKLEQVVDEPKTRPIGVVLPSPSILPEAPTLDEAPELQRYVPTPEILALTEPADVLTALGKLATPREEHELVSAWSVAGNRAALNAVAVHVGGSLGSRASRALKRLPPADEPTTAIDQG